MGPLLRLIATGIAAFILACRKDEPRAENPTPPPPAAPADRFVRTDLLRLFGHSIVIPSNPPLSSPSLLTRSPGELRSFQGISYPSTLSGQLDTSLDSPEANLQNGAAIFLRQAHVNMTDGGISPEAMISQWELLYYLSEVLKPPVLFCESFPQNLSQNEARAWVERNASAHELALLNQLRDSGFPVQPSDELRRLVVRLRPSLVYAYLSRNPSVLLHRVMTPEEGEASERQREAMIARCGSLASLDRLTCYRREENFTMHTREAWASREISAYHQSHPSVPIAIIFGGMHTFCDDFTHLSIGLKLVSVWATEAFDNAVFPVCH